MPNRLAGATSPYLLQHADNPVDWWEWSDAAFAEAAPARRAGAALGRLRGLPLVPRHGARVVRGRRRPPRRSTPASSRVKVDREERPDIDAVYMAATQAMTGQGGWPMTVLPHPGGRAVLLRHLLPDGAASGGCSTPSTTAWRERRRAGAQRRPGRSRRRLADAAAAALPPAGRRRRRRSTPPSQTLRGEFDARDGRVRRRAEVPAVDGAGVPAAPPRAHRRRPSALRDGRARPARRWPAAACTTSSPAASPATASTRAGWCRTSRRCSTTTRCCCGSTLHLWRATGSAAGRAGSPTRPPSSCCATCAPPRAASPRRSTPTPTASRA